MTKILISTIYASYSIIASAIVYRNIRELLAIDAIEKNGEELRLTEFGEILLL